MKIVSKTFSHRQSIIWGVVEKFQARPKKEWSRAILLTYIFHINPAFEYYVYIVPQIYFIDEQKNSMENLRNVSDLIGPRTFLNSLLRASVWLFCDWRVSNNFRLTEVIVIKSCYSHGFTRISHSISPYKLTRLAGLPNYILCPQRADVNKF